MNGNIEVITENLWAVNFSFVKMNFIKELSFNNKGDVFALAGLTNNGRIVMNKDLPYAVYVPFLKEVMKLKDSEIDTKQGFCNVVRAVTNSDKSDKEIMHLIWSDSTLTMTWTIYQNFCNWERTRRKVAKEYARKHPVMHLLHKGKQFLKGGE